MSTDDHTQPTTLEVQDLAGDGIEVPDFAAYPGDVLVLVSPKGEVSTRLLRLLLGLEPATRGRVLLFGQDPATLDPRAASSFRQRIGLVAAYGGLISNLKVLENLMLPVLYHRRQPRPVVEVEAQALLQQVGYREHPMQLPGLLSTFQKKQVALARAMIMDPELVIYDGLSHGVTAREHDQLLEVGARFHQDRAGRTSIYLTNDLKLSERFEAATVISIAVGVSA